MRKLVRLFVFLFVLLTGCLAGFVDASAEPSLSVLDCSLTRVHYPISVEQFGRVYAGRSFYVDHNHLGRDMQLAEGTAINPIACGKIRVYRPAAGYGTLVAVIEHTLPRPFSVRNGAGDLVTITKFLSIYGHMRKTSGRSVGSPLIWRDGDPVDVDKVIGYIQNDVENGDGAEHLHLGIRLQSADEAARTDPTAWFRGYDGSPSRLQWFVDPALFLPALAQFLGALPSMDPPPDTRRVMLMGDASDGRLLPVMGEYVGYRWYDICATTPIFGQTSWHPLSLGRVTMIDFLPLGDASLRGVGLVLPPYSGSYTACYAFLIKDAPQAFAEFLVGYHYGNTMLYAVGSNEPWSHTLRSHGRVTVFSVRDRVQTRADMEMVMGASCRLEHGGRLHERNTPCSADVCRSGTDSVCHP